MEVEVRRPLIIAHRGASAHAPENTLAAFEIAIEQQADLIEIDTKLSADQQVVAVHDQTINRTTDGSGRVADLTYDTIRKFNASYKFLDQYPDEYIPTLDEVIERCIGRIQFNIELGNYLTPFDQLATKVSRTINHYKLQEAVIVSSFHPIPLRKFHALSPEVPIGFLARKGWQGFLSRGWLGRTLVHYDALHTEKSDITPGLINISVKFGYPVHAFSVNEPREMERLIRLGVDGLITDDPLLARSVVDSYRSSNS